MFPTSVATLAFARAATPDMLFAGTIAAAMACGAALVFEENPGLWCRIGFGFFLGAATLAKGPAAVVLAARKRRPVGDTFKKMGSLFPPRSSSFSFRFLSDGFAVVFPLRQKKSGFPECFYFPAQFRALPHARFSSRKTVVVFPADSRPVGSTVERASFRAGSSRRCN